MPRPILNDSFCPNADVRVPAAAWRPSTLGGRLRRARWQWLLVAALEISACDKKKPVLPSTAAAADGEGTADVDATGAPAPDVSTTVPQPAQPPLPNGIEVEGGKPLFTVDRITPDVPGVLRGGPAGATLHVWLASPGGKRSISYEPAPGAPAIELVAAAWVLSPVGAFDAAGAALFCWNRLTGPETAPGAMPHPTQGLPLVCRAVQGGKAGAELTVSADVASWLQDIALENGKLAVRYYRNQEGWLVGRNKPGDGLYSRTFDGQSLGPQVLLQSALPPDATP